MPVAARVDHRFAATVTSWYARAARDLPWRRPDAGAWGVLVSEVMLQQTPVARVLPAWTAWTARWPTAAALAAEPAGAAVRAWGRLGYPRRALRLHAAAGAIVADHGGAVPASYEALRRLPGVGDYTAAAVAAFAFGARVAVLDTNVRRVYARVFDGRADACGAPTVAERAAARDRLPRDDAAGYSVAVMELGALVCTARGPRCDACPIATRCAWCAAGRSGAEQVGRRQGYKGTDRQARGALLAVLRDAEAPIDAAAVSSVWPDPGQADRALRTLLADGLVEPAPDGGLRLPA